MQNYNLKHWLVCLAWHSSPSLPLSLSYHHNFVHLKMDFLTLFLMCHLKSHWIYMQMLPSLRNFYKIFITFMVINIFVLFYLSFLVMIFGPYDLILLIVFVFFFSLLLLEFCKYSNANSSKHISYIYFVCVCVCTVAIFYLKF